jgi:hypothetical protein
MAIVDLKTPVWDEDKRLYRPGKGVHVPDALAERMGLMKATAPTATAGGGGGTLDGVDFASEAAREAAMEAGLLSDAFKGAAPSSANGYTKPDVQALIEARTG